MQSAIHTRTWKGRRLNKAWLVLAPRGGKAFESRMKSRYIGIE